jgi:protein-S-isoprenylcysteine O-methyltransferase Ste14
MSRVAGLIAAAAGTLLAVRSALLVSGRGRPRRARSPDFVLAGPYVRLRNPLAAGIVLALAGVALSWSSWILAGVAIAAAVGAHLWIVRVEEPRLRSRFGAAYAAYLTGVPRWLPQRRQPSGES